MRRILCCLVAMAVLGTAGCSNMSRTQQSTLSGGAIGAAAGAGLGALGGHAASGALIGGAAGGAAGYLHGRGQEAK